MTDRAVDPTSRRRLLVRSLMARRGQSDRLVVRAADHDQAAAPASGTDRSASGAGDRTADGAAADTEGHHARDERTLRYGDRELELRLRDGERAPLDDLLGAYPVFKIDAPATRKAAAGTVYVAAVADPKHLADFIEDCCRQVYGLSEGFGLLVE